MKTTKGPAAASTAPKPPGIFSLLTPYRGMTILLLVLALGSNGVNLWLPKITAGAIDTYTQHTFDGRDVLIKFMVAIVVIFLLTYVQSIVQTYASEKVARDLRTRLAAKISGQSNAYVQQVNPSRLLTNLTSDVDSIKLFVSQAIVSIASSLVIIIGASVLLILINIITPGYSHVLFYDPLGQKMLMAGGILILIGGFIISKIVDIKV